MKNIVQQLQQENSYDIHYINSSKKGGLDMNINISMNLSVWISKLSV